MPQPSVSFVIPCFNHGRFVAEAVRSCLNQADASVKVVVVDDGSDDGTTAAACDAVVALDPARVVVVHQNNLGLSAARNRGAAEARKRGVAWAGEYLSFLDADDFIDPTFVSKLHGAIRSACRAPGPGGTGPGAVSHAYCQERLIGLADMTWHVPDWDPMLMLVTNLHPVTTLVRRECFEAVGGFDESMRGGYEDWDLWLKFIERGWRGVRVREPLFTWRRHSPTTMIVEAGQHHGRLFGHLVRNHPDLYRRHADELHVLANTLLRRGEANWLDESGEAIVQRDLRRHIAHLVGERDHHAQGANAARAECAEVGARLAEVTARLGEVGASLAQRDAELGEAVHRERVLIEHVTSVEARVAELERSLVAAGERERELGAQLAAAMQNAATAHAHAAHLQQVYEAKPIIRLSKRVHRLLDRLPGFVKRSVNTTVRTAAGAKPAPGQSGAPASGQRA
jgi:glycosyltransferase involved in cell wall biosynthesis